MIVFFGFFLRVKKKERGTDLINDGSNKGVKVAGAADLGFLLKALDERLELRPEVGRDVDARGGTALLALVLKGTTDSVVEDVLDISRLVHKVEVLATSLTDDARVSAIGVDVLGDLLPEVVEDACAAREVQTRQITVVHDGV